MGILGAERLRQKHAGKSADPFLRSNVGEIMLDGNNLRNYKLADLRQQFSIILQEPVVFSATVAENIAYGRNNASRDRDHGSSQGGARP